MWQSVVRLIILVAMGYGVFRAVPLVTPPIREVVDNSEIPEGAVLGKATNFVNNLLGNKPNEEKMDNDEMGNVVDDLVSKTTDVVSEKVQEDVKKIREGVKETANEQFCRTVLKTLQEECGKYYCSEE